DDPDADPSHRARLAGVLSSMPELLGACFHRGQVCDASFSPDGGRLLARTDGGEVYLWDYERSRLAAPPLAHSGRVHHVAFSPDGSRLVTAGRDDAVRVWSFDPPKALSPPLPYRASTPAERDSFHWDRWPRFGADGRSVISFKGEELVVWPGAGSEF